jgi:hypothetical protein
MDIIFDACPIEAPRMFRPLPTIAGTAVLRKPWPGRRRQTMLENSALSGAPGRLGLLSVNVPQYAARRVTHIEKRLKAKPSSFKPSSFKSSSFKSSLNPPLSRPRHSHGVIDVSRSRQQVLA